MLKCRRSCMTCLGGQGGDHLRLRLATVGETESLQSPARRTPDQAIYPSHRWNGIVVFKIECPDCGADRLAVDQDRAWVRHAFCFITGTNRHLPATLIYFFRFALMLIVLSMFTIHLVAWQGRGGETEEPVCSKTGVWIVNRSCFYKLLIIKGGSSSVAERQLPKLNVAGSIPVSRSKKSTH